MGFTKAGRCCGTFGDETLESFVSPPWSECFDMLFIDVSADSVVCCGCCGGATLSPLMRVACPSASNFIGVEIFSRLVEVLRRGMIFTLFLTGSTALFTATDFSSQALSKALDSSAHLNLLQPTTGRMIDQLVDKMRCCNTSVRRSLHFFPSRNDVT